MILTIDVNNLKDLNIPQYAFLWLLQTKNESALHLSGITDEDKQDLIDRGFLTKQNQITDKFTHQFNTLTSIFLPQKENEDLTNFVETYRNIFPAGNNNSGYPFRGDKQGCLKKMRKFIRTYPQYSKETILSATRDYVNAHFYKGYVYMQTAAYLIEKDGISNLAGLCEALSTKKPTKRGFEEDIN